MSEGRFAPVAPKRPWTAPIVTRVPMVTQTKAGPGTFGDGGATDDSNS